MSDFVLEADGAAEPGHHVTKQLEIGLHAECQRMLDVVFEAVGAILHVVFEAIFCLTGHLVLWALTLGRWNVSNGRDNLAILIGILFWVAVGVLVWLAFIR
jgi:hypothetical protein